MLFARKSAKPQKKTFDRKKMYPVLRCSICTGEQVAGFRNRETGKFEEVMLIRDAHELEDFKAMYGIEEVTKEY